MLILEDIVKQYEAHPLRVLEGLSFSLPLRGILAILGPSGCGKTTLLRLIAGLESPDSGFMGLENEVWVSAKAFVPPERRNVGMVFQDYALFPHLNVVQNVQFGLYRLTKAESLSRAREMLERVGLASFERRSVQELSGGQQQRVAIARALAPRPRLLLLDEPFSHLDMALRKETRQEIKGILEQAQTTSLLVTHDQEEALSLADTLLVMHRGKVEQMGSPKALYEQPGTAFVAEFLGKSNLISGTASGTRVDTALGCFEIDQPRWGSVLLCVRPEDIVIDTERGGIPALITHREYTGSHCFYTCLFKGLQLRVHTSNSVWMEVGECLSIRFPVRAWVVEPGPSL